MVSIQTQEIGYQVEKKIREKKIREKKNFVKKEEEASFEILLLFATQIIVITTFYYFATSNLFISCFKPTFLCPTIFFPSPNIKLVS